MQALRKQMDQLREQVTESRTQSSELSMQLEDQQATNRELMESNVRLENEVQMVTNKYEVARGELDAFKNALRDIRSEATRTSGRVRQRYFDK
jgi:chromosome segregation ATPase